MGNCCAKKIKHDHQASHQDVSEIIQSSKVIKQEKVSQAEPEPENHEQKQSEQPVIKNKSDIIAKVYNVQHQQMHSADDDELLKQLNQNNQSQPQNEVEESRENKTENQITKHQSNLIFDQPGQNIQRVNKQEQFESQLFEVKLKIKDKNAKDEDDDFD